MLATVMPPTIPKGPNNKPRPTAAPSLRAACPVERTTYATNLCSPWNSPIKRGNASPNGTPIAATHSSSPGMLKNADSRGVARTIAAAKANPAMSNARLPFRSKVAAAA